MNDYQELRALIIRDSALTYQRKLLAETIEHRDACIRWARLWGDEFPDGARNNVAVARVLNHDALVYRRHLRELEYEP